MYEYEELQHNDINRRKLLIKTPELSGVSTSSHLVVRQEEHGKGNAVFCL
jgi:hypothetical protein